MMLEPSLLSTYKLHDGLASLGDDLPGHADLSQEGDSTSDEVRTPKNGDVKLKQVLLDHYLPHRPRRTRGICRLKAVLMFQERWLTPVKTKLKPTQPPCQQKSSLTGRQLFTAKANPVQESNLPEQTLDSLKSSSTSISTVQLAPHPRQSRHLCLAPSIASGDVSTRHTAQYDRHAQVKELETVNSCIRQLVLEKVCLRQAKTEHSTLFTGPTCMHLSKLPESHMMTVAGDRCNGWWLCKRRAA